jgi:hypothetical protein
MSFDFDAAVSAPFRMQPGLRKLADGALQLTPAATGGRHQREKLAVLSAFAPLALQSDAGFDAGPALAALAAQAAREHPGCFAWDGHRASALRLGMAVQDGEIVTLAQGRFGLGDEFGRCLRGLDPPWRLPALLSLAFEEDFAVVDGHDGRIPWLAVALPSNWDPREKVGRHFAEVHAPVADSALLQQASAALTRLVTSPQRWERFVWNISAHPRLHAHPQHVDPERWPPAGLQDPARQAWWRTERQTFIPLPDRGQAVFTIQVEVRPLGQAVSDADRAGRLAAALATMSPAVLDYRALSPVRAALLTWLQDRAAGRP